MAQIIKKQPNILVIAGFNIRSIHRKNSVNYNYLQNSLNLSEYDITLINETWTKDKFIPGNKEYAAF